MRTLQTPSHKLRGPTTNSASTAEWEVQRSPLAILLSAEVQRASCRQLLPDCSSGDTQHSVVADPHAMPVDSPFRVQLQTGALVKDDHEIIGLAVGTSSPSSPLKVLCAQLGAP